MTNAWDVVIVGGGPAGCVLAARLTEAPRRRVLLLEAGPDYGSNLDDWPHDLLDPYMMPAQSHSWGFANTVNDVGHEVVLPRAKILGGSAAVNACIWNRCSAADYDHWAELGNLGWSFDDLLPYFKKAESDPIGNPALHGGDGTVPVWRAPDDERTPIYEALIAACDEHGIPLVKDFNGAPEQMPSISRTTKNVAELSGQRVRMNPALTYLTMARGRKNLDIITDTLIDRVQFDGKRAIGVQTADGQEYRASVVILAAGAYQSPAILLRSGVGPAGHLREIGIDVVHAAPGVGESLMDHPLASPVADYPIKSEFATKAVLRFPYLIKSRSSQVDDEIDLHHYSGVVFNADRGCWTFGLNASLQYARSTGRIRLTSADPSATLDIDHRYFSDPADLEALCDGVE